MTTFVDDRHALYCGWVIGLMLGRGFNVRARQDAKGYTGQLELMVGDDVCVTLSVPPPPANW